MRRGIFFLTLTIIFICWLINPLDLIGATQIRSGKQIRVRFKTSYGNIQINLPDDMARGDMISGKLSTAPNGNTGKKQSKNLKKLNNHILKVNGNPIRVDEGWGKFVIPDAGEINMILENPKGKVADSIRIPVNPSPDAEKPETLECPGFAMVADDLPVRGKFNGDFSDTRVSMSGIPLDKVAESPRMLIVKVPPDVIGPVTLIKQDQETDETCRLRILEISGKVGKPSLKPGEITAMTVIIRGLEGLEEDVPLLFNLVLENQTPDIATLNGSPIIPIHPKDIKPDGHFTYKTDITGIKPGTFRIQASLKTTDREPEIDQ